QPSRASFPRKRESRGRTPRRSPWTPAFAGVTDFKLKSIAHRTGKDLAEPLDRAQRLLLRQAGPLAAHDEVIDTEQLAVAGDLLLYRDAIADDEAVAGEILEG